MNLIVTAQKMANLALKTNVTNASHTLKKLGLFTFMAKGINQNLRSY